MDKISIVVPCYNEEKALPLFYEEIKKVEKNDFENVAIFEYIFVDDGSKDKTLEIIKGFSMENSNVKFVSFSRNFGKEAAMYAGLRHSTGNYVTIMEFLYFCVFRNIQGGNLWVSWFLNCLPFSWSFCL